MLVWMVEDNPLHQLLFDALSKKLNFSYEKFSSLTAVKNFIEQGNFAEPKLIFIDLHLENGEPGEDVLNYLKTVFADKVKYIAFTADVKSKAQIIQSGFDNVIYKPITKEKLEKILNNILKNKKCKFKN